MLSPVTLLFESAEITLNGHQLLYQIPESSAGNNVANGQCNLLFHIREFGFGTR
jgi:hypothetical protein